MIGGRSDVNGKRGDMRMVRRVGGVVLALLALWLLLAVLDWAPWIPAEQRAALARLRSEPAPLPGRNATIYSWLVDRDIAQAEWPRWLAMAEGEAQSELDRMRPVASVLGTFGACLGWGQGCLARVRENPGKARALRDALAARLRRIEWVQRETGHVAAVGRRDMATPFPPLGSLQAPVRLDVTLRFLDGDHQGALERLCRHALWWRTIRRETDLVFAASLGVGVLAGAGDSYAELLQALPPDQAPPAVCEAAFAPLADADLDLCRSIRGEFMLGENLLASAMAAKPDDSPLRRLAGRLAFDAEASAALQAPAYDYWCSAGQRARAAARAEAQMTPPGRCRADGWVFNFVGCTLSQIAAPTLPTWYQRALDLDGRLRLVASVAWLRQQAAADPAASFARRPAGLRDDRHAIEGPRCAAHLVFTARHERNAPSWRLPLAPPADCPPERAP
jgi:hypothetical protein